jgi:hypothetical protein
MFTNQVVVGGNTNITLSADGSAGFLGGGVRLATNGFTYILGSGIADILQIESVTELALAVQSTLTTNNSAPSWDMKPRNGSALSFFPAASTGYYLGAPDKPMQLLWVGSVYSYSNSYTSLTNFANAVVVTNSLVAGSLIGDGALVTNLDAGNISAGTLSAAQLPASAVQYTSDGSLVPAAGTVYAAECAGPPAGVSAIPGKAQIWFDTNSGVLHAIQDDGTDWAVQLSHP